MLIDKKLILTYGLLIVLKKIILNFFYLDIKFYIFQILLKIKV